MRTKRKKKIQEVVGDSLEVFSLEKALEVLKNCPEVKFDQTIEFSLKMGVDPKKSDQQVRGTVALPHGTGKKLKVVVLAKGEKQQEAKEAGANEVGSDDLIEKIKGGWTDFDVLIVTPDMMREVGKLGKVLGPRGLMPTPKAGTVTNDIKKSIEEVKAGKIEFKVDKNGVINAIVGKLSFASEKLAENIRTLLQAIARAKPASAKGIYMKSLVLSSSMGPGVKANIQGYI